MPGITHLPALGFMGLVMLEAIMQMLPVVAGTPMRRPEQVASFVHTLATGGIILLCFGLVFTVSLTLKIALPILGTVLLLFAAQAVTTLRRALPQNMTARTMRLAVLIFAATVLRCGCTLPVCPAIIFPAVFIYPFASLFAASNLRLWLNIANAPHFLQSSYLAIFWHHTLVHQG